MNQDHVVVGADRKPTAFVGKDAIEILRVRALASSISLHQKCGMIPTRGVTITKMFTMATVYTGQRYKRGQHEAAIRDLKNWLSVMESAIPVVTA